MPDGAGKVLWRRPVIEALNSLEDLERLGIQPPQVTKATVQLSAILLNGGMAPRDPQDGHSITVGSGSHAMGLPGYQLQRLTLLRLRKQRSILENFCKGTRIPRCCLIIHQPARELTMLHRLTQP